MSMFTSWYNFPSDLAFFDQYRTTVTPQTYASGRAMHLVIWTAQDKEHHTVTKYGDACGAPYPLSPQFQEDMKQLAIDTGGEADGPPLFVSMFTEFQTYPCNEDGNYWDTGRNGKSLAAHYKPDNDSEAVYDADMASIFTPESMASLQANGLFGFSFMDADLLKSTPSRFEQAKSVTQTYAKR